MSYLQAGLLLPEPLSLHYNQAPMVLAYKGCPMPDRLPLEAGSRFMTAPSPGGMGLQFYAEGETIVAPLTLDERHEGPPQHVHGGFSAALLDEMMGTAVSAGGL